MKAWVRHEYGGVDQLKLQHVDDPVPQEGDVLVKVHALGINRAELYFRSGKWGDVAPISGIECVGEVVEDRSGRIAPGTTVAAFMGGLGRTRSGSYAEYTCARSANVVPLRTKLPWEQLAAIPESYSTAWATLFQNLGLAKGNCVVIRGATSSLGLAALNLAKAAGIKVIATTRDLTQASRLKSLGASHVLAETFECSAEARALYPAGVDGVLDLIGNATVADSMKMARFHSRVCVAGFLGGFKPVELDVFTTLVPSVSVSLFVSILFGEPGFSLDEIPLQSIVDDVERGRFEAAPVRVFPFEELPRAQELMESNSAKGKIVVKVA